MGSAGGGTVPSLLEFLGEPAGADRDRPFLVPIRDFLRLRKSLASPVRVEPLGAELVVPEGVLAPVSTESVALVGEALDGTVASLPRSPVVLDMGCGSGCLSLLAALRTADREGVVVATDILPEALAATRLNRDRMVRAGRIREGAIEVTGGGDLFDPVEGRVFDLILFNAPWVTTQARSLPERSTHDEGQDLLRRFLEEASPNLVPGGSTLLEYSDHSGPRAIENLHLLAEGSGWCVRREWKTRIQARRKSPKWERIFVFDLVRAK